MMFLLKTDKKVHELHTIFQETVGKLRRWSKSGLLRYMIDKHTMRQICYLLALSEKTCRLFLYDTLCL
jgi:glucose-6-phosphate 1-dehydrogenase